MTNFHETLHPDSEFLRTSTAEEVVKKTDSGLRLAFDEDMKQSFPDFIIKEVKNLNPDVKIESDPDRGLIFSSVDIEKLVLPEWFYYNQKNGITNKHNTKSGIYGSVHVYPIELYDPELV